MSPSVAWRVCRRCGVAQPRANAIDAIGRHHGPDGILARTWPTGSMAFWTTVMLAAYLILSYL